VNHHVRRALAALKTDTHDRSGWVRRSGGDRSDAPESYVPGSVRGFTSYTAPAAKSDRVMYEGGDWSEPCEVTP